MPGWYNVVVSPTDVSVLGDLAYHITATGADPIDFVRQVVEDLPGAASYATTCADALLTRDWTSVSGEAARSVLNALRFLRNKWTLSGSTLSVKKEDDATEAWNAATTNTAGADPVTGVDPT